MRRSLLIAAAVAALAAAAPAGAAKVATVDLGTSYYAPAKLTVKKGDKVSAVVSPLRNGDPGSLLTRITLPDGRVLGNGGPAGVGPGTTAPPQGATSAPASPGQGR